jgi:hypothetical protein
VLLRKWSEYEHYSGIGGMRNSQSAQVFMRFKNSGIQTPNQAGTQAAGQA